ncbi:hypothetical protein M9H77_33826 [Catharanthus roseus]|uniref:Uncharacterized protein n=1 Tax=Catharanthus roseus TaxID=4058 RepID=A0ACB9ZKM6_CATRO|nr:hypothetical protein M9H77_33826 [Catharanthus roseus]
MTSGIASSHSVSGSMYKARERIHYRMTDRRLQQLCFMQASCSLQSELRTGFWDLLTLTGLHYPAFTVGTITGTSEVRPSRSYVNKENSSLKSRSNNSIELTMIVCLIASTIPGMSMNLIITIAQDTLF